MTGKQDSKQRAILLKKLREEHKETVGRTQELLKAQKALRRQLCQHMRQEPKSVPELAALTGIPTPDVLWHITAMKKYGLVQETGMCGEYYLYLHVG
jgi:predicted Rossmann fold nucleotide-binding protein DprA/Smf involved in DNA uptake